MFVERLERTQRGFANPEARVILDRIGEIVEEGNRRGLLDGTDRHGRELVPTEAGHSPLTPRGASSRAVADFEVEVRHEGDDRAVIKAGWPSGTTAMLQRHAAGEGDLPVRDVLGIRPETKGRIRRELQELKRVIVSGE